MPIVEIKMTEGRTNEQKEKLIAAVTRAVAEVLGIKPELVTVIIQDVPWLHWGVGGTPFSKIKTR